MNKKRIAPLLIAATAAGVLASSGPATAAELTPAQEAAARSAVVAFFAQQDPVWETGSGNGSTTLGTR